MGGGVFWVECFRLFFSGFWMGFGWVLGRFLVGFVWVLGGLFVGFG